MNNEILTAFTLAFEPNVWINFGIQAHDNKMSFFHNCLKIDEREIKREPAELNFESASTFYLAQAGNTIQENFEVKFIFKEWKFNQLFSL